jgi:pyruvate kinase
MKEGVDFIALSFVRRAEHIDEVRRIIAGIKEENPEACTGGPCLIAKIENEEGFKKRGEILAAADGIMVARGDLGVEVPPEEVPLLQESLIELANRLGKPVITATEMLESMVSNPRPTRAEVTDIAHAIISGTDAVMLSAETAVGRYPVQAVEMMARVARRIESSLNYAEDLERRQKNRGKKRLGVAEAISHATCQIALDLGAQAIITATQSGGTARMVSMYRPRAPILAATPNLDVARVLSLSWGVTAILVPVTTTTETTLDVSVRAAVARRFVKKGDLVVITGGLRTGIPGTTNLLQVHEIEADARDAVPMEEPAGE